MKPPANITTDPTPAPTLASPSRVEHNFGSHTVPTDEFEPGEFPEPDDAWPPDFDCLDPLEELEPSPDAYEYWPSGEDETDDVQPLIEPKRKGGRS